MKAQRWHTDHFPPYDLLPWETPQTRFPWWTWIGLAIMALCEVLMLLKIEPVYTHFTMIVWWGYIAFLDGLIKRIRGVSFLADRPSFFAFLAILSVVWWLMFEFYNCYLENWVYIGLPLNPIHRYSCYLIAFATITPAILITYETIITLWKPGIRFHFDRTPKSITLWTWFIVGLLCVTIPLLIPNRIVRFYLFGPVWIGFIFMLEPLLYKAGSFSLLRFWSAGGKSFIWIIFVTGTICGLLWEFWNYWAGGKWLYTVPLTQTVRYFEMPILGFLGFLPFAWECLVLTGFTALIFGRYGWTPHIQKPETKYIWYARLLLIYLLAVLFIAYHVQDQRYFPVGHIDLQSPVTRFQSDLNASTLEPTLEILLSVPTPSNDALNELERVHWTPLTATHENFQKLGTLQRHKDAAVRHAADMALREYGIDSRFNWSGVE